MAAGKNEVSESLKRTTDRGGRSPMLRTRISNRPSILLVIFLILVIFVLVIRVTAGLEGSDRVDATSHATTSLLNPSIDRSILGLFKQAHQMQNSNMYVRKRQ